MTFDSFYLTKYVDLYFLSQSGIEYGSSRSKFTLLILFVSLSLCFDFDTMFEEYD